MAERQNRPGQRKPVQPRRTAAPARRSGSKTGARPAAAPASRQVRARRAGTPEGASKARRATGANGGRARSTASGRVARGGSSPSLGKPSLWTKEQAAPSLGGRVLGALGAVGAAIMAAARLAGRGIAAAGRAVASVAARSRVAAVAMAVVAALLVAGIVDTGMNWGKVYPGVHVGEFDVSGMTVEEAQAVVEEAYGPRLAQNGTATIYASEEAKAAAEAGADVVNGLAEQQSVDQANEAAQLWTASTAGLSASLPAEELAQQALAVGRDDGGVLARLQALVVGRSVDVYAQYDEAALEQLAQGIDAAIGSPRVDFNIAVEDGTASVTEGNDGSMVDRDELARGLDGAFLLSDEGSGSFVAYARYAPLRITRDAAQAVCDQVNAALADGAVFLYGSGSWQAAASAVGEWVQTSIEERDGAWQLVPGLSMEAAKGVVLAHAKEISGDSVQVTFEVGGDGVTVLTDGSGAVPLVADAVASLDLAMFGGDGAEPQQAALAADGVPVEVAVDSAEAPESMGFDEALDAGIVSEVSSYTTEYTSGSGTEARNHNIHLAADVLSNSVAKAQGGTWSFNDTAGDCNEERGFQAAGAIVDGEYVDSIGGGICQVATTVFNAVYEAGYPIPRRSNHSLYIASYPAGRDAAVSYPDLDLRWTNDGASDVLLRMSYTDSTVTATLYGVSPGYQVSTEVGEWEKGEEYTTKYKLDESLAENASYIKTSGTDGRRITVVRTVKDSNGNVLHEDTFTSDYKPKNEVKVVGPGAEADAARAEGKLTVLDDS